MPEAYYAQCQAGHIWKVEHNTPLEARSIARHQEGHFDAICIHCDECAQCRAATDARNMVSIEGYGYSLDELMQDI
jgi:hypothetical protein